jgi:hypothetical protein
VEQKLEQKATTNKQANLSLPVMSNNYTRQVNIKEHDHGTAGAKGIGQHEMKKPLPHPHHPPRASVSCTKLLILVYLVLR